MRIEPYLHHIPEIERRFQRLQPDAIVIGLGRSAYLLPWIDQKLLEKPRRFGVHDACRIMPVDDLIVMDAPVAWLNDGTGNDRFQHILNSRPKRWWFWPQAWEDDKLDAEQGILRWKHQLPKCLHGAVTLMPWINLSGCLPIKILDKNTGECVPDGSGLRLDCDPPQTGYMSPVGAMTLAWKLGCRRIGVIGMDCMPGHQSHGNRQAVQWMMKNYQKRAIEAGGMIANLSPFSLIGKFNLPENWTWKPSECSSAPTNGSVTQGPSASSNTASGNVPPAASSSLGCEQEIPASR